ncbi:O-antigen ligase family protein [Runella slithyformis]|uniref:O-antigen ligase-related domain-containing protein n=1 Tax=Runella slithyformis (strain ATCC 29530 / DSM 19594 / LMG 11500 / NCIMB 11436 / LSU 4) TaxID=761193 RepID=A0A7U3ZN68_RUNSL|nr:O-antigen ligase family protein [Runella slithyformis]AEI50310.1 hypothetical protein Runsl_3957 [Runella slithyformis DSM 19594]
MHLEPQHSSINFKLRIGETSYNNAVTTLFCWGFLGYPLSSFISDALKIESNEISIIARVIFIIIAFTTALIGYLIKRPIPKISHQWLLAYLFFWILYLARVLYECIYRSDLLGRPVSEYILFAFFNSFIGSLCFLNIPTKLSTYYKIQCYFFSGLLILNLLSIANTIRNPSELIFRGNANTKLNTITYAILATGLISQSLYRMVINPPTKIWNIFIPVLALPIGMINLLLSGSRGPILSLGLGLLWVIIFVSKKQNSVKLLVILGILSIISVLISQLVFFEDYVEYLKIRLFADEDSNSFEGTNIERITFYSEAWQHFLNNPITGDALEVRLFKQYAHNIFLEALMSIGIIGGFLSLYLVIRINYFYIKIFKKPYFFWLVLLFTQQMLLVLFNGSIGFSSEFWYCATFAFSTFSCYQFRSNSNRISV